MIKITAEDATKWIKEAVAEKGEDYIYPAGNCEYFDRLTKEPKCIVGHVFKKAGVDPDIILKQHDEDGYSLNETSVSSAAPHAGIYFDSKTLIALTAAQSRQDARKTWGDALGYYLETMEV